MPQPGDTNRDGTFDRFDLVAVLSHERKSLTTRPPVRASVSDSAHSAWRAESPPLTPPKSCDSNRCSPTTPSSGEQASNRRSICGVCHQSTPLPTSLLHTPYWSSFSQIVRGTERNSGLPFLASGCHTAALWQLAVSCGGRPPRRTITQIAKLLRRALPRRWAQSLVSTRSRFGASVLSSCARQPFRLTDTGHALLGQLGSLR